MADQDDTPRFETDEVQANLAIEHGQGVGARELAAQRDPGGAVVDDESAGEDETFENGKSARPD
ncbi:hypothetical protein GVN18_33160 [Pseudomonas sp. ODNR1LW]|nr:hypothetical protein [Pseudomonas sp. ODNR1LW]